MSDVPQEPERGFSAAAAQDKSWGPRLKDLAQNLSPGDKSVLMALLSAERPDRDQSIAMTSRGSPNDWFWAHLAKVGWMEEAAAEVPEPLRSMTIAYRVTPEGQRLLPGMLPHFFRSGGGG